MDIREVRIKGEKRYSTTSTLILILVLSAFYCVVGYLVVKNSKKMLTQEISVLRTKLSLLLTDQNKKVVLYNIIDEEARTHKGVEFLTPQEKRLMIEVLLEGMSMYGKRGQNLALILSIIKFESSFNPKAVSPIWEARGHMQVIDSTMKYICDRLYRQGDKHMLWQGPEDSYDIERNLKAGMEYLDEIHMLNVQLGHEKLGEIGWMTLYEYEAGARRLRELQSGKMVTIPGMDHQKNILEGALAFLSKGL